MVINCLLLKLTIESSTQDLHFSMGSLKLLHNLCLLLHACCQQLSFRHGFRRSCYVFDKTFSWQVSCSGCPELLYRHLEHNLQVYRHSNTRNYFKRWWTKNHTGSKVPYGLGAYFMGGIKEKTNVLQQHTQQCLIDIMANQRLRSSSSKCKPLSLNFVKQFSQIQHFTSPVPQPLWSHRGHGTSRSRLSVNNLHFSECIQPKLLGIACR